MLPMINNDFLVQFDGADGTARLRELFYEVLTLNS